MNDLANFLQRLANALDDAGLDHMFAGSLASTFHGMPRSTQDVDVVVALAPANLRRLLLEFPDDHYYVSETAARDAVRRGGQFNVIDLRTGWKADLIVKKHRPYSDTEFQRRIRATIAGVELWLATAEDTVISKLEWARRSGGSERQLRDVRGILERSQALDRGYIDRWVEALDLGELWSAVRDT